MNTTYVYLILNFLYYSGLIFLTFPFLKDRVSHRLSLVIFTVGILASALLFFLCFSDSFWDYFVIPLPGIVTIFLLLSKTIFRTNWALVFLIPLNLGMLLPIACLNNPVYNGAMDGFATPIPMIMNVYLFFIFPAYLFLLMSLKMKTKTKALILLTTALASFILGITLSWGKDGFFSDYEEGYLFIIVVSLLALRGVFYWLGYDDTKETIVI